MRDSFVHTLIELAKRDRNIELITGDLGFGVLKPFWEAVPNQFTNAGIAEQNMASVAAGMALAGKTVIIYSIGNFPTLRCLEQLRNDCAYHHANVKIVCVGGGFVYGSLGMSHHATEDLAIMRALPEVAVFAPGDAIEAIKATQAMIAHQGTCYLRLGRGGEKQIHSPHIDFQIGKALPIRNQQSTSKDSVALFSTGGILEEACEATETLLSAGIGVEQLSFPTVKPIDREAVCRCALQHKLIITIEEHNIIGGLGSAVAEIIGELPSPHAPLLRLGIPDEYCIHVGSQQYLRQQYKLQAKDIAHATISKLKSSW